MCRRTSPHAETRPRGNANRELTNFLRNSYRGSRLTIVEFRLAVRDSILDDYIEIIRAEIGNTTATTRYEIVAVIPIVVNQFVLD